MKFLKKVLGIAALAVAGGWMLEAAAESLNADGVWTTTVKVTRGQEHTFWVTGLTEDSAVFTLDVTGAYEYKEDGQVWEDDVSAFESCDVENSKGGWDMYVLLTAEDWDWVPSTVKSVTFTVTVEGLYDEDVPANNKFTFGHVAGRDAYPGGKDPPPPQTPVGRVDNPKTFSMKVLTSNQDLEPGTLQVEAAQDFGNGTYYIKTPKLVEGQKYRFGYDSGTAGDISSFVMSSTANGTDNLFASAKVYEDWTGCDRAYEIVMPASGEFFIKLANVSGGNMFTFFHVSLPALTPAKHLPNTDHDLAVGAVSAEFSPGYLNTPTSYAYDAIIDEQLFRITGYEKGDDLVFRTEGSGSDLIMRLYDSKGKVLAENFTAGAGSKECQLAWTTTAKYAKASETTILYLGVCQKLEDGVAPTAGPVRLSVERVSPLDEPTAVTAVPDKTGGDPRSADGVIPSAARSLGREAWANTFTLAARKDVTYKLKARMAAAGEDNGLSICATVYTGKNRTILQKLEKSDLIDPKTNGYLTFTPTANDTVYVEVTVADGAWGAGKGLTFGAYEICATAAGDYGILQVPMGGAPQALMGWKIIKGTSGTEPYYPAGAGAIVKAGTYTVAALQAQGYEKVDAKGFADVAVTAGTVPSSPDLYRYRDTFDPDDDAWDGKPTEIKPTSGKSVEIVRSLWKDDDPADWYVVKPTADGLYYRFALSANEGSPYFEVFGPDSTNSVCKGVPTADFDTHYLKQISTEKGAKYYVRVMRELDTDDNSYVLTASAPAPGEIKLTKTAFTVKEGTAYVDVGVSRTGKDGTVMLKFRTEADSARPGEEYYPTNGVLTWLAGDQKEKKIRVNLIPTLVAKWYGDKSFRMVFETFADGDGHRFGADEFIPRFQVTSKTTGSGANRVTTVTTNDTVTITLAPTAKKVPGTIQLADCENPKKPVVTVVAGETAEIALERVLGTNGLVGVSVVSVKGTANKSGETDFEPIDIPELLWNDGASGKSETIRIVTKKTPGDFTGTKTFTLKLAALRTNTKKERDGSLVDPRVFDNPTIASQTITVNIVNDKYEKNVTDYAKDLPKAEGVAMKEGKKDSWFREVGAQGEEFYSVVSRKFNGPSRLWWGPTWDPLRTNMFVSAKGETVTMRSEDIYTNDLLQAATPAAPTVDKAVFAEGDVTLKFDPLPDDEARGIGYRVYILENGAKVLRPGARSPVNLKLGDPETEISRPYTTNVAWRSTSQQGKYTWRVDSFFKGGTVTNTAKSAWSFTVLKDTETGDPLKVEGVENVYSTNINLGVTYALKVADKSVKSFTTVSGTKLPDGLKLEQDKGTVKDPGSMDWYVRGYPTKAGDFQAVIQATYDTMPATKSPTYVLEFHVNDLAKPVALKPTVDKAVVAPGTVQLKFSRQEGAEYKVYFKDPNNKGTLGKDETLVKDPDCKVEIAADAKCTWKVVANYPGQDAKARAVESATFNLTGAPAGTLYPTYETKVTGKDAYNADYAEGTVMRLRQRLNVDFLFGNDYAPAKDVEIKSVKVLAGKLPDGLKTPAINTFNARTNPTGDNQWHILGAPTKAGTFQAVIQTTYMEVYERDERTGKPKSGKTKDFAAVTKVMDFVVEAVDAPADLSFTLAGPGRLVYTATDARIPLGRDDRTETKTNFIAKASETLKLSDVERLHGYEYVKLDAVTPKAPFATDKAVLPAGWTELTYYPLANDAANGIAYRVFLRDTKKDTKLKLGQTETEVTAQYTNLAENASYEWRVDSFFTGGPVTNSTKVWKFKTLETGAYRTQVGGRDAFGRMCGTVGNVTYTEQSDVINLYQGVKANFAVATDVTVSKATVAFGKLPDGVKLEQNKWNKTTNPTGDDKWYVRGTPTKAGDFEVIVQASYKDDKNKEFGTATYMMRFHVRAAGSSIGTFNGLATSYDSTNLVHRLAQVQFTSAAGRLSSKVTIAGKSYTFADTGFVRITGGDPDDETVPATLVAELTQVQKVKEPKWNERQRKDVDTDVSYTNVLTFTVTDAPLADSTVWATNSMAELTVRMEALPDLKGTHGQYGIWYDGKAYRDNAQVKEWAAAAARFAGYYTVALVAADADQLGNVPCGNGYMTLTLDAKGKAKVAGALADGTSYSGSATAAFDLVGDEIAVRVPLYACKGTSLFGGWLAIRYPKGCAPTENLAETPLDAVPVAVCEFGDTTMAWLNEDPNSTYYGYEGHDLTLCPVGGWYDTVINLQRYYRSADFPYYSFGIDTACGNDLDLLEELLKENNEDDYAFIAEASANGQAVDLIGNNVSVEKQALVKRIDPSTGKAGKFNDWSNSVNSANVKLTFKRATGIVSGTCDLWYNGYKSDAKGDTTYEEKSFANCKHAGVLLLSRDPAQNWLGDTDEAFTWSAGSVVIPQTIPLENKKTRKWNASFRFNIRATKVNRSWDEQPPY